MELCENAILGKRYYYKDFTIDIEKIKVNGETRTDIYIGSEKYAVKYLCKRFNKSMGIDECFKRLGENIRAFEFIYDSNFMIDDYIILEEKNNIINFDLWKQRGGIKYGE